MVSYIGYRRKVHFERNSILQSDQDQFLCFFLKKTNVCFQQNALKLTGDETLKQFEKLLIVCIII